MTRTLALLGVLLFTVAHVGAQTVQAEPPFVPAFPSSRAVGDALVASAQGFESLYTNPAGFALGKPSFTIASVAPGVYLFPGNDSFERLGSAWSSPESSDSRLAPDFSPNGFGGTMAAGIAYTGAGLGLGLLLGGQSWGRTPSNMSANVTLAFVGGMGFSLGQHFVLGGAVRPMLRVNVPDITVSDLFSYLKGRVSAGASVPALYGVGVALDFGAIARFDSFSYGIALSDIGGTRFAYAQDSLQSLTTSITGGNGLPTGKPVSDSYIIPMRATLGVSYHPKLGTTSRFFEPTLEIDYSYRFDPARMLKSPTGLELLDGIHAGADLRILSVFHLFAGYQYGRVSGGLGVHLPGFWIDTMAFQQVAPSDSAAASQGVSAGIAIRF